MTDSLDQTRPAASEHEQPNASQAPVTTDTTYTTPDGEPIRDVAAYIRSLHEKAERVSARELELQQKLSTYEERDRQAAEEDARKRGDFEALEAKLRGDLQARERAILETAVESAIVRMGIEDDDILALIRADLLNHAELDPESLRVGGSFSERAAVLAEKFKPVAAAAAAEQAPPAPVQPRIVTPPPAGSTSPSAPRNWRAAMRKGLNEL